LGLPRPAGGAYDIGAYELGALAGDFNHNGVVDMADYVLWRNSVGSSANRYSAADADSNGVVDQADYAIWRGGFGTTAGGVGSFVGGVAVPEPSTLILLCFLWLAPAARVTLGRF
jgi:hypothetical protein